MSHRARLRRFAGRLAGRRGPVPTPEQLARNAMRHLAGASLVVLAAAIAHQSGHSDQQWQYVAVAGALGPQALLALLALKDPERRARLRASSRAAPVPLGAALVIGVAAVMTLLTGDAPAVAVAAICAATGLTVAAAPVTVTIAPRPGDQRQSAGRDQDSERPV